MKFKNEDDLIARLTQSWTRPSFVKLGVGHDCAALAPLPPGALPVLKTDALVENVHFLRSQPPRRIGHKAIARVLSDFAASGARPRALMIALGLPEGIPAAFLRSCYEGMKRTADTFEVALVGGETTRSSQLWFCVSGLGIATAKTLLSRKGAKPGDSIYVTGTLGGSSAGKHLRFLPRLPESQWLVQHCRPSAMMDLSDGLGKDLPRLALASRVSFRIHEKDLPLASRANAHQAVNDGEDYELLFTVPKTRASRLEKSWPFSTRLTRIGEILPARQSPDTDGLIFHGFDHLAGNNK